MAYTTESFIKKAREVHGDKYDYSKVNYERGGEDVTIICPKHGEFSQNAYRHLHGYGCKKCGRETTGKKWHDKCRTKWVNKAIKIHGNKYDYSKVDYSSIYDKVCIICPEHGEFWQTAISHIAKHQHNGCPECGKQGPLTNEEFIEKAKNRFSENYDYSKVKYVNAHTDVEIVCPKHGSFFVTPMNIKSSNGCPQCFKNKRFIEKARKIFGNKYDYSKVEYVDYKTEICIIDENGKEFWQTPEKHMANGKKYGSAFPQKTEVWDYDKCYNLAKKYIFVDDFKRENRNAWRKAKKMGWENDYVWLSKDFVDKKNRCVYVYEFNDGFAYVGLTNNIEKRDAQHRNVECHKKCDSVFLHGNETSLGIPKPKILEDNLSVEQAKNFEKKWISTYEKNGWNMLNKRSGGSIGATRTERKTHSKEEIIKICRGYKNMEELYNKNRYVYYEMNKMGIKKECFPNATFVPNMAKPRNYTEEYIFENVNKYATRAELRKNDVTLYSWMMKHERMYEFYDKESGHRKF